MFAVTGITGQVGGAAARTLLDTGLSVRAVMRDTAKGAAWKQRGCEIALADIRGCCGADRRSQRRGRRICNDSADLRPDARLS